MNIPTKPVKFTNLQTDFGTTIAKALWVQAAQMLEYVNASYPIGMIMFYQGSNVNIPEPPDPNLWQLLDGSVVANTNSIFHGVAVPDFRNMYFRHPVTEAVLHFGGANTLDVSHDHRGYTTTDDDTGIFNAPDVFIHDRPATLNHFHTVPNQSLVKDIRPDTYAVQMYMRIA